MDVGTLKIVGQVAGIGGLALGVFLLLFRDIIRKNIFPTLPPAEAYKLLRLIAGAVWSVAIIGVAAWVYVSTRAVAEPAAASQSMTIDGDGNTGTQILTATVPPGASDGAQTTKTVEGQGNTVVQEKIP